MSEQLSIQLEIPKVRLPRFTGKYDNEDDLIIRRHTLMQRYHTEPELRHDIQKALKKTNGMLFELTGNNIYNR